MVIAWWQPKLSWVDLLIEKHQKANIRHELAQKSQVIFGGRPAMESANADIVTRRQAAKNCPRIEID